MFSPGRGPAGSVNAFDAIKPEKTTQLDVGMQYRGDKVDAWVSGYAGYVRTSSCSTTARRHDGTDLAGLERERAHRRRRAGRVVEGRAVVDPGRHPGLCLGREPQRRPRPAPDPAAGSLLSAAYDDGVWSAGALWRLVAPQKRYALNSGNVVGQDFGPSAGFGVFSLNAGYAISKQVKLSLGVDNLFDKAYAEHLNLAGDAGFGFPGHSRVNEPGRSVWARVSVKY